MFINVVVYLFMFNLIMLSIAKIIVLNDRMINLPTDQPTNQGGGGNRISKSVNRLNTISFYSHFFSSI
jgi:hypothetical protein